MPSSRHPQIAIDRLQAGHGRQPNDPERAVLEELVVAITPATTRLNARVWSNKELKALARGAAEALGEREQIRAEEALLRQSMKAKAP